MWKFVFRIVYRTKFRLSKKDENWTARLPISAFSIWSCHRLTKILLHTNLLLSIHIMLKHKGDCVFMCGPYDSMLKNGKSITVIYSSVASITDLHIFQVPVFCWSLLLLFPGIFIVSLNFRVTVSLARCYCSNQSLSSPINLYYRNRCLEY